MGPLSVPLHLSGSPFSCILDQVHPAASLAAPLATSSGFLPLDLSMRRAPHARIYLAVERVRLRATKSAFRLILRSSHHKPVKDSPFALNCVKLFSTLQLFQHTDPRSTPPPADPRSASTRLVLRLREALPLGTLPEERCSGSGGAGGGEERGGEVAQEGQLL